MSKSIVLDIKTESKQPYSVSLQVDSISYSISGSLPPATDVLKASENLRLAREKAGCGSYRKLEQSKKGQITKISVKDSAKSVETSMNTWLNSGDKRFQPVRDKLLQVLSAEGENVRLIIQTDDIALWEFPWHLWDVLHDAEIEPILSKVNHKEPHKYQGKKNQNQVRILVVMGEDTGINIKADLKLLTEKLHQISAYIKPLIATSNSELNDELWRQHWDILFFAGHSSSNADYTEGKLALSEAESITIKNLKYGLENAIQHGLKLAIFNSCDGMGLVQELASLQIPAVIAMRERVPDEVAQKFLEYLLDAFAIENKSLDKSVGKARKKLDRFEVNYPGASWLPMIYESPGVGALTWIELLRGNEEERKRFSIWRNLQTVLMASAIATGAIVGVRSLQFLEPLELPAYDYLMRQREAEAIDPRITVVEINQQEVDKYGGYPIKESALAEIVKKVEKYKPAAFGLDISRNQPRIKDDMDITARKDWIEIFKRNKNFYTVCSYQSSAADYAPLPEFSPKQLIGQVGFVDIFDNNIQDNKHQTVRRQVLSYEPNYLPKSSKCITPYSFSFLLAFSFLSSQKIEPLQVNQTTKNWELGGVTFNRLASHTGGYQSLDGKSSQILLNYRANPRPAKIVSLTDILEGKVSENAIKDRVVIVGYTAEVARDDFDTPYGQMPGVWIHTHMTSQILSAVMDNPKRPLLGVLPQWGNLQWGDAVFVWLWAFTGGVLVIYVRPRLHLTIVTCVASVLLYHICLEMLNQGRWMPLVPSALALVATGSGLVIHKISQNRQPE
ncbi:putative Chase2 sensor protein [Oscillatoria nigro-viridis PCC 7112]|uniref:Putative Chase2 sensor protein n=1 Tax=Phormidium nigroviride PCC 7112 TaxID=179408 RepID=K9VFW1_9CYAN|nr:CHASE2 domain-containing protein [Oscillatoria nigro-viridis]AFZ06115.1 putative Chase2 sensor protein [Oscillatoria nigro-viridis PCC 7112]